MRTQRAVRRLHLAPVDHDVLLPLLELALKAPTSSNSQDWSFVIVEDREQKARLARLWRRLYRFVDPIAIRQAKGDERELRQMRPGQWQAEHFDLTLLAVDLPRVSGLDVLRAIRASDVPGRPLVVLMSDSHRKGEAALAYELDVDEFVLKPFTLGFLTSFATSLLADPADDPKAVPA